MNDHLLRTIMNNYATYNVTTNFTMQKLQEIKGTIFRNTLIITEFNILLSVQKKSSGQKISKKIDDLNSIINSVGPMN